MRVKDVMTPKVISVGVDETVVNAARLMLQQQISGLPVVDKKGELVGIVTEGDFLRRGELGTQRRRPKWLEFLLGPGKLAQEYVHASSKKIEDVMTPDPRTIGEDEIAGGGGRYDGAPSHQAHPGDPRRSPCWHCQPRQPDACAREVLHVMSVRRLAAIRRSVTASWPRSRARIGRRVST